MIKFSEQQLKVPKLMRPVYLVTAGQSKFDRAMPDKRTEELCVDALTMAAEMIDMEPAELKKYIHTCYYGHFADHFGDQLLGEAVIHDRLGLDPLGNVGVKTGGATGGSTLWEGSEGGCLGLFRLCPVPWAGSAWTKCPRTRGTSSSPARRTRTGKARWGISTPVTTRLWRRSTGRFSARKKNPSAGPWRRYAVKHHGYARFNPYAQAPMKITVDDVLKSPVVAYPLRALDACVMSVGAACGIICDEDTAMKLTKGKKHKPLRIWVTAGIAHPAPGRPARHGNTASSQRNGGAVQGLRQEVSRRRPLSRLHGIPGGPHGGMVRLSPDGDQ